MKLKHDSPDPDFSLYCSALLPLVVLFQIGLPQMARWPPPSRLPPHLHCNSNGSSRTGLNDLEWSGFGSHSIPEPVTVTRKMPLTHWPFLSFLPLPLEGRVTFTSTTKTRRKMGRGENGCWKPKYQMSITINILRTINILHALFYLVPILWSISTYIHW